MVFSNTQKGSIGRSILTISGTVMVATGKLDGAHLEAITNTIMMLFGSLFAGTGVVAGIASKEV